MDEISYRMAKKALAESEQITNNGEIKGFKPVTQIEYDALTTEQKEDGTVYLIEEA
jgi:hypothetical protein